MSGVYLGIWPPIVEHNGTGSAVDDWPPRESDDAADDTAADDWPPRESEDTFTSDEANSTLEPEPLAAAPIVALGPEWQEVPKAEPPKPWTPPVHQSEYMKSLQHIVDNSTDAEMYWMRAGGCDLMPARWRGVLPPGMPERPGQST